MKGYSKVLWGVLFVIFGIIVGLNVLGLADIEIFFDGWWTLFIIVPSIIGIFSDDDKKGALFGLIIGIVLLLVSRDVISFGLIMKLLFPFILVMIGLSIIWDAAFDDKKKNKVNYEQTGETESYAAVFGEDSQKITKEFKGASLDAVFGEIKIDLRDAKVVDGAVLKVSAIFGGAEVLVPDDVILETKETKIFGGVDKSRSLKSKEKKAKTLYVDVFVLFGGVDIR